MNRFTSIVIAGVVGTGLCAALAPAESPTVASQLAASNKPDEAHEVHRVLGEAADRALGSDGATKLLDMVAASDRERIDKEFTKGDANAYQTVADKVHKDWKDKYGHAFSGAGHADDLKSLDVEFTGKGHGEMAIVKFPAETGESGYELHLTREKNGWWRINVPDTVDGKTFYSNTMAAVDKVEKDHGKWPASADAAYPVVVTELLKEMAFSGK